MVLSTCCTVVCAVCVPLVVHHCHLCDLLLSLVALPIAHTRTCSERRPHSRKSRVVNVLVAMFMLLHQSLLFVVLIRHVTTCSTQGTRAIVVCCNQGQSQRMELTVDPIETKQNKE